MGQPVVHWELWSKEPERTGRFYAEIFGWNVVAVPDLSYHMVDTQSAGGINGGIMKPKEGPWPGNLALYIDVDDLDAYRVRITAAGGKTLVAIKSSVSPAGKARRADGDSGFRRARTLRGHRRACVRTLAARGRTVTPFG